MTDHFFCLSCFGSEHVIDHTSWDRVCCHCGVVSAPEVELEEPYLHVDNRNPRSTHFHNCLKKLHLPAFRSQDVLHLERLFHESVADFMATRGIHGRRYMMNYPFLFHKLFQKMGYSADTLTTRLKLPKLKKTLEGLEELWLIMEMRLE